jgi:hypothetical protein
MNYNHNEYEDETFIIIVIRACYNRRLYDKGELHY